MLLDLFIASLVLLFAYVTIWSLCRACGLVSFGPGDALAAAMEDRLQEESAAPRIFDSEVTTDRRFAVSVYRVLRLTESQLHAVLTAAETCQPTGSSISFVNRVCRSKRIHGACVVPILFSERESVLHWSDAANLLWLSRACLQEENAA